MDLKVRVKGLGKISEGEVNLKGFTLFAGRNNTGKTYLSKAIYSSLKGISSNHAWNLIGEEVRQLHSLLALLHQHNKTPPTVLDELRNLAGTPSQFLNFLDMDGSDYAKRVRNIASGIDVVYKKKDREKMIKKLGSAGSMHPEAEVLMIEDAMDKIKDFATYSGEDIVKKSVSTKMGQFFIENFRIGKISNLAAVSSEGFTLNINGCLEIESKGDQFSGSWAVSSEIVNIPSLFFMDSVGFKVNSRLIREVSSLRSNRLMVPEIAGYHTDLLNTIEAVTLIPEESLKEVISNIAKSIGGKLEYDNGSLHFHEDGVGIHDASITSSGILQLGLLGLMVEKGLLREGSFLFIDEPEANLHPAWQTLISGLLAELALKGKVKIVMATHSPYIVQYLRYGAKHDDEFNSILSVNHFADKGINKGLKEEMSNYDRLDQIEDDLDARYMDIFLRGEVSA